jgi:hypothetical protein
MPSPFDGSGASRWQRAAHPPQLGRSVGRAFSQKGVHADPMLAELVEQSRYRSWNVPHVIHPSYLDLGICETPDRAMPVNA